MAKLAFNLEDKAFMVTGGSRGIGLEIAGMLLDQKAKVVICGRKQEGLDAAVKALNAGDRLKTVQAHIAKSEEVDRLFNLTIETFGCIDGLINNVGMNIVTSVVDADPELWTKIIDSNLNGTFLCSRKAGQIMDIEVGDGRGDHIPTPIENRVMDQGDGHRLEDHCSCSNAARSSSRYRRSSLLRGADSRSSGRRSRVRRNCSRRRQLAIN